MSLNAVRRAAVADAADVFAIVEEYYDAVSVTVRDDRASLMNYLTRSDCGIWLAFADDSAVGCILYHPLAELPLAGEIKRLYVQPACRGRGLAQLLHDDVEQFAVGRGDRWLYIDTHDGLRSAIAFYERNGYRRCARYNDNPQATIFMRKPLHAPTRQAD